MLFTFQVEEVEGLMRQAQTLLAQRERNVRETLRELLEFCEHGEKIQKENDEALQRLHRELGEAAGAANQQQLTGLLTAPTARNEVTDKLPTRTKHSGRSNRVVVATGQAASEKDRKALLHEVEQARVRSRRLNFARIKAWIIELQKAIQLGNCGLMQRATAGLMADLANAQS